jgi:hypothetical protein
VLFSLSPRSLPLMLAAEKRRASGFTFLRPKLRRLLPVHYAVLRVLVRHIARVALHALRNKIDVCNLATTLSGMLVGEGEHPYGDAELLAFGSAPDSAMADVIEHTAVIFDERTEGAPPVQSPPGPSKSLPPLVSAPAPVPPMPQTEAPPLPLPAPDAPCASEDPSLCYDT